MLKEMNIDNMFKEHMVGGGGGIFTLLFLPISLSLPASSQMFTFRLYKYYYEDI